MKRRKSNDVLPDVAAAVLLIVLFFVVTVVTVLALDDMASRPAVHTAQNHPAAAINQTPPSRGHDGRILFDGGQGEYP